MSKGLPWTRIALEGIVIVGSILLAFGIDAWWDAKGEQDRQIRHLVSLSAELAQNEILLNEAREYYEARYLDAISILEALDGSARLDASRERSAFQGLLSSRTFHLESGAHEALVGSGELELIDDELLRMRIAAWPSFVAEWKEEQDAVFSQVEETLVPALQEHFRFRGLVVLPPFPDGEAPLAVPPGPTESITLDPFRGSEHFDNLVFQRAQGLWHAMRDGETLRAELIGVRTLIEESLSR